MPSKGLMFVEIEQTNTIRKSIYVSLQLVCIQDVNYSLQNNCQYAYLTSPSLRNSQAPTNKLTTR